MDIAVAAPHLSPISKHTCFFPPRTRTPRTHQWFARTLSRLAASTRMQRKQFQLCPEGLSAIHPDHIRNRGMARATMARASLGHRRSNHFSLEIILTLRILQLKWAMAAGNSGREAMDQVQA